MYSVLPRREGDGGAMRMCDRERKDTCEGDPHELEAVQAHPVGEKSDWLTRVMRPL
jgi:hypothetical protein